MKITMIIFLMVLVGSIVLSASTILSAEEIQSEDTITFFPIEHATFVLQMGELSIYVDPVGSVADFAEYPDPAIILITDIHHDHLDKTVVDALKKDDTLVIGPQEVIDTLGYGKVLRNGEHHKFGALSIEAVPMYNLAEERVHFHAKGRGNGYLLIENDKRIYISGDTEDIPEMRNLRDIDYALVCMNLPYTMTVEQAASAVLEFKPKEVIPYHYRGKEGFSDIEKFKEMVSVDPDIHVQLLEWYK